MLQLPRIADPFAVEDLLKFPLLPDKSFTLWQTLEFDTRLSSETFQLADVKIDTLPNLELHNFQLDVSEVSLPELDFSSSSHVSSDVEDNEENLVVVEHSDEDSGVEEDVWSLSEVIQRCNIRPPASWEHFLQEQHIEPRSGYLSEAGAETFTALLSQRVKRSLRLAPADVFLVSLFELGLGKNSAMFQFDALQGTFETSTEEYSILGFEDGTIGELTRLFVKTGNMFRKLLSTAPDRFPTTSNKPTIVAFNASASSALFSLQCQLEKARDGVKSLLQLRSLFERPSILLEVLSKLGQTLERSDNSREAISTFLEQVQLHAMSYPWVEELLQEILSRTLKPGFEEIQCSVGLGGSLTLAGSLNGSGLLLDPRFSSLSSFGDILPPQLFNTIYESVQSLGFLQHNSPDHPLHHPAIYAEVSQLGIEYSWEAISKLHIRANEYERNLNGAIFHIRAETASPSEPITAFTEVYQSKCDVSPFNPETALFLPLDQQSRLGKPLSWGSSTIVDPLQDLVLRILDPSTEDENAFDLKPSIDKAISLSLTPILTAQHRLLSFSILQMLLKESNLRAHLNLQYQFQGFGDRLFASRLSQALFDADQANAEGRRSGDGNSGLRLHVRDTWPPASSELRLVLMGILSESMAVSTAIRYQKTTPSSISDSMSFAIRELSDDELERCRDVDSICALDFLCLHYKAPSTLLESILTRRSLRNYDRIFKHQLRLLRVNSATQNLLRQTASRHCTRDTISVTSSRLDRRFRIEIHHLVSTLADYAHSFAVGTPWHRLDVHLAKLEACFNASDYDGSLKLGQGLDHLRRLHERGVECMVRGLFLGADKPQVEVRGVLEEIFGIVLRFAGLVRRKNKGRTEGSTSEKESVTTKTINDDYDETTRRLYEQFKKQVGKFIANLKQLTLESESTSVSGPGSGSGSGSSLCFDGDSYRYDNIKEHEIGGAKQLLLQLDLFGYWSRDGE